MTKAQEQLRKQLLAKIHMHPRHKLIKASGAWEEWLTHLFGVGSSRLLSINELLMTLQHLDNDTLTPPAAPDVAGRALVAGGASERSQRLILHLSEELGLSHEALMRFVKRQTGRYYLSLEPLSQGEASKVIVGLRALARYKRL